MHHEMKPILREPAFYLALFLVIASMAYWIAYSNNAYNTYHEYGDIGLSLYNMFFDLHYSSYIQGVQWAVFANHIAIDQFLVLPFFAVSQTAMTLLVIQSIVLPLTALLLFFVARDLIKSNLIALFFCIAFLLNPGIHGMLIFDYHAEDFIIPFYILVFYFFMKQRSRLFYLSTVLLLLTIEEAPFLALTLGLALFLYSYYSPKSSEELALRRRRMLKGASVLAVSSIIALAAYGAILTYLTGAYATSYALPPQLHLYSSLSQQVGNFTSYNQTAHAYYTTPPGASYLIYAFVIVALSFGIAVIFSPGILFILLLPWLVEVLAFANLRFIYIFSQHYSYAIGCTIVAALLGIMMAKEKRGIVAKYMSERMPALFHKVTQPVAIAAMMGVILVFLFALEPVFLSFSGHIDNMSQIFLFRTSPLQQQYFDQLSSVIADVPPNASLATQDFVYPHVFSRKFIEILDEAQTIYFRPGYVLVDFNTNVSKYAFNNNQYVNFYYLTKSNYSLIAYNGLAALYKHT